MFSQIKRDFNNKINLAKINFLEASSDLLTTFVVTSVTLVIGIFALLFASLALAWYLGLLFNNLVYGFALIWLLYTIVLVLLFLFRKNLFYTKIMNWFIGRISDRLDIQVPDLNSENNMPKRP